MSTWEQPTLFVLHFASVWIQCLCKNKIPIYGFSSHYSHYFGQKSELRLIPIRTLLKNAASFRFAFVLLLCRGGCIFKVLYLVRNFLVECLV